MTAPEPDRLSQISTDWKELFATRCGSADTALAAQREIVLRYCPAVYHYLLATTRDVHVADDLAQEFALRFLRGDFRRADPAVGRFRDFIKTVLYHLVVDHVRGRQRSPQTLPDEGSLPTRVVPADSLNDTFTRHWRQEILDSTWRELRRSGGEGLFDVLRWKASTPEGKSADGARELTARTHREITPAGFRQTLHRAREKFAELLLKEVANSLGTADPVAVEQELSELELIDYCRPLLSRPSSGNG